MRNYTDLSKLDSIEDRYDYLKLGATVGDTTFDDMRWVNQAFYHSTEWRQMRKHIIARDGGMDLGAFDTPIRRGSPVIHHMNPLTLEDIEEGTPNLLDPEFLISTSLRTHNAIHYGDDKLLPQPYVERRPNDTIEWERLSV